MKKFFTLAIAILCSTISMIAAGGFDLIIKTNSEKIEALIQEVSDTEIRYKKANNPNGPMFVIKMSEISSIVYSNGEVQAIEHQASYASPQQYGVAQQYPSTLVLGTPITRNGNMYFQNGKSVSEAEYLSFIQNNCIEAWQSYQSGVTLKRNGWILLGTGLGSIALGTSLIWAEGSLIYSPILWGAGAGLSIGSIPCLVIGGKRMKNSHEIYNMQCVRKTTALEVGVQSSKYGLGFALKF